MGRPGQPPWIGFTRIERPVVIAGSAVLTAPLPHAGQSAPGHRPHPERPLTRVEWPGRAREREPWPIASGKISEGIWKPKQSG
jgi:hypothetical protein